MALLLLLALFLFALSAVIGITAFGIGCCAHIAVVFIGNILLLLLIRIEIFIGGLIIIVLIVRITILGLLFDASLI